MLAEAFDLWRSKHELSVGNCGRLLHKLKSKHARKDVIAESVCHT
jgi:hypothetical protein